ncbi:hypothetical protein V8E55_002174 [Tylopilus felleus]
MRCFWNISDLAWPLHVKVMFRRPIISSIFLLRMTFVESCHAADTLSSTFTTPYPHSCDTFFSSRSPLCCPFLPFLVLHSRVHFLKHVNLVISPRFAINHRPFSLVASLMSIPACHYDVNPHVPWVNLALMPNACCSSITSASTRLPRRTLLHSKGSRSLMNLASRDNTFVASSSSQICHNNVHVAIIRHTAEKENENKTICEMLFKTHPIKSPSCPASVL